MKYLDYINHFWQTDRIEHFSKSECYLYFILLNECNIQRWKMPFEVSNKSIVGLYDISEDVLIRTRNALKQKGMIDFEPGKRKQKSPTYTILNSQNKSINTGKNAGKSAGINTGKNANLLKEEDKDLKENKKEKILSPEISENIYRNAERDLQEVFREINKNALWKEQMCMKHHIPGATDEIRLINLEKLMSEFYNYLSIDLQVKRKSINDTYQHFSNWLSRRKQNGQI